MQAGTGGSCILAKQRLWLLPGIRQPSLYKFTVTICQDKLPDNSCHQKQLIVKQIWKVSIVDCSFCPFCGSQRKENRFLMYWLRLMCLCDIAYKTPSNAIKKKYIVHSSNIFAPSGVCFLPATYATAACSMQLAGNMLYKCWAHVLLQLHANVGMQGEDSATVGMQTIKCSQKQ